MSTSAMSTSAMSPPTLELRLRLALDRFDLELELTTVSRAAGVFGPSGAGKTSLLRAVAGLARGARGRIVCAGEVWLDSERGIDVAPERRGVGYVPQEGLLFPHLDVRANLLAGARRARRSGHDVEASFAAVCELLELGALLDRRTSALSGGERQRVALGRAICSGPRLLLLDEPLASLDLPLRRRVLPFLRRVRRELDLPMLLVTHDTSEVQALCEELLVLRAGKEVRHGPARAVLTDPAVFSLTEEEGYVNVIPGTLVGGGGATSEVQLSSLEPALRLRVPRVEGAPGHELLLGIPARELILASREPVGLSAQNVLAGVVAEVAPAGELRLITVALARDVPHLAAIVTAEAQAQLGLVPGRAVYVILKTAGCIPYDGHAG